MGNTNEEKRYKIEKIESGIKNAALYETAKAAMLVGLIAMVAVVDQVLIDDYNMDIFAKNGTTLEQAIGWISRVIASVSFIRVFSRLANLFKLGEYGKIVKDYKKEGEESLDFNELKFTEYSSLNSDAKDGPLKSVILNGFFEEDKETISEGDTKKR